MDELGARMSAREFVAWQVFAAREPFGEERADLRSAAQTAALVNAIIAAAGGKPTSKADNFLLDFDAMWDGESADEPTAEEQADNAARLMARMTETRDALIASR